MNNNDVYQKITDKVIEIIESKKILPWQKPWTAYQNELAPQNLVSKTVYKGVNFMMTYFQGFSSNHWLTFKQARSKKWTIRKGEKGTPIMFWTWLKSKTKFDDNGKPKEYAMLKYYWVWNLSQLDGENMPEIKEIKPVIDFQPIKKAQDICNTYFEREGVALTQSDSNAYYRPSSDIINMPDANSFKSAEDYYSTLFHELGHSTGHKNRLNRKELIEYNAFGSHSYSCEELTAELTSAMLCGHTAIDNAGIMDNSVAYLRGWMKKLKDNPKWLISAGSKAEKATQFILNGKEEKKA